MNARADRKEQTHEQILASATKLLRTRGISAASVAEVMRGVGLTVGGFYAHFGSKDALVAEALRRALRDARKLYLEGLGGKPVTERARTILRRYLSRAHRDSPDEGCPLPAVVAEVGACGEEVKLALADELSDLADELGRELPSDEGRAGNAASRQRALGTIALMFGGLSLARTLRGTPLSDEILKACRAMGASALGLDDEAAKPTT